MSTMQKGPFYGNVSTLLSLMEGFCKILRLWGSLFLVFLQIFSEWEGEGCGVWVGTY